MGWHCSLIQVIEKETAATCGTSAAASRTSSGTPHASGSAAARSRVVLLDGAKEVARVKVNDNLHPRGRVGLRTWWSAYRFKNIRVTAPDGRTLWEGPPAIESPRPVGPAAPKNPYREGWVSLFNGKDLSGWTAFRGDDEIAPEEIFFVDRNELACFPGNRGRLATQAAYSNFVLSLDYHIGPGEVAGLIFLTVPAQGVHWKRFECQIYGEQPNDAYGCGDIYSRQGSAEQAPGSLEGREFLRPDAARRSERWWVEYLRDPQRGPEVHRPTQRGRR